MNDDDEFHGWVTARTAVEQSYNLPTMRLALATGLPAIVDTARKRSAWRRTCRPVPSIAIGSFEVAPVELVTAYAAFANDGVRVHARTARRRARPPTARRSSRPIAGRRKVLSPQSRLPDHDPAPGGRRLRHGALDASQGLADPVAGKTGTSNNGRDNWFVGYTPERATVVWVGFDDDSPTPFSGSKAALPLWTKFTLARAPASGYSRFTTPDGIRVVLIDPVSGELATERCPEVLSEAFPRVACRRSSATSTAAGTVCRSTRRSAPRSRRSASRAASPAG